MLPIKSVITAVVLTFAWTVGANAAHESPWIFPSKATSHSPGSPEASLQAMGMAGRAGLGNTSHGSACIFPRFAADGKALPAHSPRVHDWLFARREQVNERF